MVYSDKTARVIALLDDDPKMAELSSYELARRCRVSQFTACRARAKWLVQETREVGRCRRCGLLAETRNPVDEKSGLCLWCRLEMRGVRLLDFYESGTAHAIGMIERESGFEEREAESA